jgi:hypothetical protein
MNQLGGIEPGHSMFGGRWNRADGLLRQIEQKQLEEEIKEDENNGVIIPLEKRLVRSTRLKSTCSTPYDYNLYLVNEDETKFIFSINPTWFEGPESYNTVTLAATFINGNICINCSLEPGFDYDNYSFITNKNGIQDIKTVRVDISFSSCYNDQYVTHCQGVSDYFPFNWVRP